MKPNILCMLVVMAPLVSASSLGGFEATCNGTGCGGSYGNTFAFFGPFPGGRISAEYPNYPYNPFIEFSIGTNGGSFTSGGNTCDYGVLLGGGKCDAGVLFGANIAPPDIAGLSLGDVVNVKGTGIAEGYFCWDGDCPIGTSPPPSFRVNVTATYQFTLTDPGTSLPLTWSAAQFTSVPEPGTLVFATVGLAVMAAGVAGRGVSQSRNI